MHLIELLVDFVGALGLFLVETSHLGVFRVGIERQYALFANHGQHDILPGEDATSKQYLETWVALVDK